MLRKAAALALLAAFVLSPLSARAQPLAIPPGREAVILEAVREAFTDSPAAGIAIEGAHIRVDTGEGPRLDAVYDGEVRVSTVCEGECDAETTARWTPVAARLRQSLAQRADALWVVPQGQPGASVPEPSSDIGARQALSWALLALALAALFVAPGAWPPGRRTSLLVALAIVLGFFVAALALGPRPLHDHLCFLDRTYCASTLKCDTSHHAWGRSTFHVMGLLLQLVPHRLGWILGLGVALTALALLAVYDVTTRAARHAGLEERAGHAGLWAIGLAALHPGFLRLAGTGAFWPLTLVLLFGAFHLLLRAGEGSGWRQSAALVGAACAFTLALGGSRLVLTLAPLLALAPAAWPPRRAHPLHALLALVPLAAVLVSTTTAVEGDHYGVAERAQSVADLALAVLRVPFGALSWTFTTPLALPLALVALASRRRLRAMIPFAYAFVAVAAASVFFTGPIEWRLYPDVYLKHFPQIPLVAPLFGVGCAVLLGLASSGLASSRLRRGAPALVAAAALLLIATAWTRPEATRLLFAERVMEREVAALEEAFEALPPHDVLVVAHRLPPPDGMALEGDPLEMHFPHVLYRAALRARGLPPARVVLIDDVIAGRVAVDGATLLYVGSTLRTFYPSEMEAGRVHDSLEREPLARLRERFALEPAHVFTVPTQQPRALVNRVAADRRPRIELGFYWLVSRERASR